jgi:hypothetical protein
LDDRVAIQKEEVAVDELIELLGQLRQMCSQPGINPDVVEAIESDLETAETQAQKPKLNATLILSRLREDRQLLDYESIRVERGEEDYSEILEKIRTSFINLGGKIDS